MKHLLLLLFVLPFCQADAQLQNGGFEDLNSETLPYYWKWISDPVIIVIDSTGAQDSVAYVGGRYTLNSTEVHSGDHAMEIGNGYDFTTQTPFLGTLVASYDTSFAGGFPLDQVLITERPQSVHFFAEYFPEAQDSAFVEAQVYDESYNELGTASLRIGGTVATYTEFVLPITYTSSAPAAYLNLRFNTSTPGGTASFNTRLLVDDVSVENEPTGVPDLDRTVAVPLYPDPVSDVLNISVPSDVVVLTARVTDALGRGTALPIAVGKTLDCSGLADGVYRLMLRTNQGIVTKSFMVLR